MSSSQNQNNTTQMPSGMQHPVFASVSQNSKLGEDIDLNDVFADYFINEVNDPLNSFTNFYQGAPPSLFCPPQAAQPVDARTSSYVNLPTGHGIRTAWYTEALPFNKFGSENAEQNSFQPQADVPTTLPAAKRPKGEEPWQPQNDNNVSSQMPAHQVHSNTEASGATSLTNATGSAISGRLGFSLVEGQLAVPQSSAPLRQQTQTPASEAQATLYGNVALPVGVGICLGGSTGAVLPQAGGSGVAMTYAQWGPAGTSTQDQHGQYLTWGREIGKAGLPGSLTKSAVAERRLRNREHAKRSRVRKKFLLESLQQEVRGLQKENQQLRMIVQGKVPQHAQQIISECCKKSPLFEDEEGDQSQTELVKSDFSLIESLTSGQQNFVLSDPRLPDNPIVYASEGFYELTGYSREQVLGRNCRFLQGPGTDPKAVDIIRTAIANGTDSTICLLNYKADGTPFWNQFFVAALRDADNCIVNYVGVQCAIEPEAGSNALEEKVNAVLPLQQKDDQQNGGVDA